MKNFAITIAALAALWMLFLPASSPAQDNEDKIMKQRIEESKTGPQHKLLSTITGDWDFTGRHFLPGPDKKTIEFKGTAERRAIMDGRYFIFETTGGALKMPWSGGKEVVYRDMFMEGYDNKKKKFVSAMIGNHWNTGITASEGLYDPSTSTITYESGPEPADAVKTTVQSRLRILDKDHYTVEIYLVSGGNAMKRSEINYTRKAVVPDAGNEKGSSAPGEYHRMLARSAGKWTGKATMWFSPDASPVDGGTAVMVNKMSANGLYQVSEILGNPASGMGKPWTGLRITGYDSDRKVFTRAMIGDGNAAGGVAMEGRWDEASRSITMPFKKSDPTGGRERNLKEVYSIVDENTEILEIFATDEKTGKEFKMLNVKWTKNNTSTP